MSRGLNWLQALAGGQALAGYPASVKVVDGTLGERAARYIAVVPDAENPFPRARNGEVGLLEGKREALLRCLAVKFGALPDRTTSHVRAIESVDELHALLERVVVVASLEEMGL